MEFHSLFDSPSKFTFLFHLFMSVTVLIFLISLTHTLTHTHIHTHIQRQMLTGVVSISAQNIHIKSDILVIAMTTCIPNTFNKSGQDYDGHAP